MGDRFSPKLPTADRESPFVFGTIRMCFFRRRWSPGHRQSRHIPRTVDRNTICRKATNIELLFSVISRGSVGSIAPPRASHEPRTPSLRSASPHIPPHLRQLLS